MEIRLVCRLKIYDMYNEEQLRQLNIAPEDNNYVLEMRILEMDEEFRAKEYRIFFDDPDDDEDENHVIDPDIGDNEAKVFKTHTGLEIISSDSPEIDSMAAGRIYLRGRDHDEDFSTAIDVFNSKLEAYDARNDIIEALKDWATNYNWKGASTVLLEAVEYLRKEEDSEDLYIF